MSHDAIASPPTHVKTIAAPSQTDLIVFGEVALNLSFLMSNQCSKGEDLRRLLLVFIVLYILA
jgi:hypothetical protein